MWPHSNKPLRLALIGMSGAGKSYWTTRIAAAGYPAISCDTQIETRLKPALEGGGYSGINGVAAWMGWPHVFTYAEREAAYLSEEIAVLDEVLTGLEKNPERDLVLDTTGSVIYAGNHLLHRLRKQMLLVYLAASRDEQQLLIQRYLQDPKPVLWRGAFQARPGEDPKETVARCYPMLIGARRQSYEAIAHCSIAVSELRPPFLPEESDNKLAGTGFLERVRQQLERAGKTAKAEPTA
jgi:shikimate kinase